MGLCALCREALAQSPSTGLLDGFYLSILLLVGAPIVLVLLFVWALVRARRRAGISSAEKS